MGYTGQLEFFNKKYLTELLLCAGVGKRFVQAIIKCIWIPDLGNSSFTIIMYSVSSEILNLSASTPRIPFSYSWSWSDHVTSSNSTLSHCKYSSPTTKLRDPPSGYLYQHSIGGLPSHSGQVGLHRKSVFFDRERVNWQRVVQRFFPHWLARRSDILLSIPLFADVSNFHHKRCQFEEFHTFRTILYPKNGKAVQQVRSSCLHLSHFVSSWYSLANKFTRCPLSVTSWSSCPDMWSNSLTRFSIQSMGMRTCVRGSCLHLVCSCHCRQATCYG